MVVKTIFSKGDFRKILSNYRLGEYINSQPITQGTTQTNYLLLTTKGKFVFRYYENRCRESVLFESNLIKYLKDKNYPCPNQFRNSQGNFVSTYDNKPYIIFEFVEGQHVEKPNEEQKEQLIKMVASLHNITKNYRPSNKKYRWNYNVSLCKELARKEAEKTNTLNAKEKLMWLERELSKLKLPRSLPKGICHCDFHFSNVLFKNNQFKALIDFDDANYTYLMFDLVGLIEYEAWQKDRDEVLNFNQAKKVMAEYVKYRPLNDSEKQYLFDVYKLSVLFDCVWYFARGDAKDFYEKEKIDHLNSLGRKEFYNRLFN